uniref:Integrase catalytic domain-containing protein n=1 Tax=Tanacetum cinerariifolium TaxID=118510 RepID=A0A6L2KR53_TANCI|nr:hypothetical protein [Tanacetum cinerariifolium]
MLKDEDMIRFHEDIPVILCKPGRIFPLGFFDSMEHLLVNLPDEASVEGLVQYRWMYPFVRFLGKLKRKMTNKAKVESSIANAYLMKKQQCFVHITLSLIKGISRRLTGEKYVVARIYVLLIVLRLKNMLKKYLGTVRFGNDQFALILGYGDLVQGNTTIRRVYYVECLNHNLFSVGQFCDADLEVALRKSTCFVRDLQGNDLLTGNRGSDLYIISLQLFHLNFDTINMLSKKDIVNGLPKLKYVKDQLCSSCELGKAKRSTFKTKTVPSSKGRLKFLHMDLCGHMRIESINGKKYILVIFDNYSHYTWTYFLRSKDETHEVPKDFLKIIQQNLQAQVITVRTNRGIEFLNKTLHAYFKQEGIEYKTSTP